MPAPDRERIMTALSQVNDPELGRDIVSLGMVQTVNISEGGEVVVRVRLTTPACPLKSAIQKSVADAVRGVPGVTEVKVELSADVARGRPADPRLPGVRNIIAVGSGKGGVGKSTVAVNIALALARTGARVGLLDADVYGPSIPIMLGLKDAVVEATEVGGRELMTPVAAQGMRVFSIGFLLSEDRPVIWRGPLLHKAVQQFLEDVAWGELDYLVVDLPPGTGDVQLSLSQLVPVTAAMVVTTPQDVAFADVLRAVRMFEVTKVPVLGVVENMASFVCPNCKTEHAIFGKGRIERLATEHGIAYLGALPLDPEVSPQADQGRPIVAAFPDSPAASSLSRIASQIAARLSVLSFHGDRD